MSYLDQTQDPGRRATAVAGVAAIHAAIAVGLVWGLTVTGAIPQAKPWNPFTLTPDPLPQPPPKPDAQPSDSAVESVVTMPTPPIDIVIDNPVDAVATDIVDRPVVVAPLPTIDTRSAPPSPAPAFTPRKPRPANDPLGWLSTDDYPAIALRRGSEGVAGYRLIVAADGRVSACDITRSTGDRQLDDATCRFIARRARFEAATDHTGAKVSGTYTGTVKWDIPN